MLRRLRPEPFILAFTAAWIVGLFSASTGPLQDLWRPLAIGVGLAAVLAALVSLIPGRGKWPSIILAAIWLGLLGAWPLALGVVLISAWRLSVDAMRRAKGRTAVREPADEQVGRILGALGAAAVVIALSSLVVSGAVGFGGTAEAPTLPDVAEAPSIYTVLLDGYPAIETLEDDFGFDGAPFVSALEDRGFDVAERSRSNYNRTLLTLSSMLHMEFVDAVPGLERAREGFSAQNRQLTAAINTSPVPSMLSDAGYRSVSISSSYGEATVTNVDQVIHTGALTLFEEQLLRYTTGGGWIIGAWPELVGDQHRQGVLGVLAELRKLASSETAPTFAMTHVFSPHTPFVFNADGSPRALLDCYPEACGITTPERGRLGIDEEAYRSGLVAQVEYLNGQLLETVDAIVAEDPEAVIVLFSDHGARYEEGPADEHFQTFLAARTPGHDGLFDGEISLVNLYPTLFNAYFGSDLAIREYRASWAPDSAPLEHAQVESGDVP
jgi:hypothetical protein